MTKRAKIKKSPSNEGIQADNIHATAIAVGREARAIVTNNRSDLQNEIDKIFAVLTQKVEALPDGPDKTVALSALNALDDEAKKGEKASEENVTKWFTFLAKVAPDAWEVAVATFLNPIQGISLVFKKVAEKAKINKKLTMHIARHTFGNISGEKISLQMLQKLYRHSSITTTIGYQANFIHKEADEALNAVIGF